MSLYDEGSGLRISACPSSRVRLLYIQRLLMMVGVTINFPPYIKALLSLSALLIVWSPLVRFPNCHEASGLGNLTRLLHAPVQILEYGFRFMQRVVHLSIGHNLLSRDWSASLACENLLLCKMCRQCSFLYFSKLFAGD